MAQETNASLQIERLDGGCSGTCKGSVSAMEDEKDENLDNLNQLTTGKPPRNVKMVRHCSSSAFFTDFESEIAILGLVSPSSENSVFLPIFRSGSWSEKGPKQFMEDEHICIDNLHKHLVTSAELPSPGAFYGVFDGHGGTDAAAFTRENILNFIVEDSQFPSGTKRAIKSAFVKTDHALADTKSIDSSSGTTVLMALIWEGPCLSLMLVIQELCWANEEERLSSQRTTSPTAAQKDKELRD